MEKERKIKVLSLVTLIVAILGLTVAFAALSQTLTINGTANVDAASWDIHFESLDGTNEIKGSNKIKINDSNEVESMEIATISDDKKSIEYFGLVIAPGDTVSYEFKIVNKGTIDANIGNINISKPSYYYTNLSTCDSEPDEGFHCDAGVPFAIYNEEVGKDKLDLLEKYYTTKLYYKDTNEEVKQGDKLRKGEEKEVILKVSYDSAAPSSLEFKNSNGMLLALISSNQELTITYVQD